jgi:hypothetical protein
MAAVESAARTRDMMVTRWIEMASGAAARDADLSGRGYARGHMRSIKDWHLP